MKSEIVDMLVSAQIGTPAQGNLIERHMEDYFKRFPSQKSKLTNLEWYHLFLDFFDTINAYDERIKSNKCSCDKETRIVGFYDKVGEEMYCKKCKKMVRSKKQNI